MAKIIDPELVKKIIKFQSVRIYSGCTCTTLFHSIVQRLKNIPYNRDCSAKFLSTEEVASVLCSIKKFASVIPCVVQCCVAGSGVSQSEYLSPILNKPAYYTSYIHTRMEIP